MLVDDKNALWFNYKITQIKEKTTSDLRTNSDTFNLVGFNKILKIVISESLPSKILKCIWSQLPPFTQNLFRVSDSISNKHYFSTNLEGGWECIVSMCFYCFYLHILHTVHPPPHPHAQYSSLWPFKHFLFKSAIMTFLSLEFSLLLFAMSLSIVALGQFCTRSIRYNLFTDLLLNILFLGL